MTEKNQHANHPESLPALVLFDGFCHLCNRSVDFIMKRDSSHHFRFVALQSEAGAFLRRRLGLEERDDSVILLKEGKLYYRSDAALRIALQLKFPWPLMGLFLIIPRFMRDRIYSFIANNRYRWFGIRDACRYPSIEERDLFPSRDDLELQVSRFVEPEQLR